MGAHSGSILVYGPRRLRLPGPDVPWWVPLTTAGILVYSSPLVFVDVPAAVAVGVAAGVYWAAVWLNRVTTPRVRLADRYHWERAGAAMHTIATRLPQVGVLGRKEVRRAVQATRWDLARLIQRWERLTALHRDLARAAAALPAGHHLRADLEHRQALLAEETRHVQADVEQRIERLERLARHSAAAAAEQARGWISRAAERRAQRILDQADAGLAKPYSGDAGFTEYADAVLVAYRELMGDERTNPR